MSWTTYIGPTIVPTLVAGAVALLVVFINRWTSIEIHKEKFKFDKELSELKFAFEKKISLEKINQARQQVAFERKFELAEQILSDAYQLRDLMSYVRNGAVFEGEGQTREKQEFETESEGKRRLTYFVPLERLHARAEFISAMMARRSACRAHFGDDADEAFEAFQKAIQLVRIAASMLGDLNPDHPNDDKDFRERLRRDIWQPLAEYKNDDRVGSEIDAGVKLIEQFCVPVLRWVDSSD